MQTFKNFPKALNLCLYQNYCQLDNNFYTQKNDLSSVSPKSLLLAEIFMPHVEHKLHSSTHSLNQYFWVKFVTIFSIWTGTSTLFLSCSFCVLENR